MRSGGTAAEDDGSTDGSTDGEQAEGDTDGGATSSGEEEDR